MEKMNPVALLPLMLSCADLLAIAKDERVWAKVYKRV